MNIDTLFKKCGKGGLKANLLMRYVNSPFSAYCDIHAPKSEKDPTSSFQELLMTRGIEYEKRFVERNYPDLEEITFKDDQDGFRKVLEAMAKGTATLHGLPLFWQDLHGRFDLAEKDASHKSDFGNYHYIIKELKSARNIREKHILQAAMYNYMLGQIQGYTPAYFYLINGDGKEQKESYKQWEDKLMQNLDELRQVIDGTLIPTPTYGGGDYPWKNYADKQAIAQNDVSLVSGVKHGTKRKLLQYGIITVQDLAETKEKKITAKLKRTAQAVLTGKAIVNEIPDFKKVKTEIYMDFESTDERPEVGLERIDYLIGLFVCNGKEEYKPFIAHTPDDEGKMFKDFLHYMDTQKDFILYHWHTFEKTRMKHLMDKYNVSEKQREHIFGNMVDLHKIATKSVVFPTYGAGLKPIARWRGFQWRHDEVNAQESIAMYLDYAEDNKKNAEMMHLILDYNEDDCVATKIVKDYLVGLE